MYHLMKMEGTVLIVSNVSNKQMNVGKMQIKGGYHGNLSQVTFPWHLSH